jgi:hypothetical protein
MRGNTDAPNGSYKTNNDSCDVRVNNGLVNNKN